MKLHRYNDHSPIEPETVYDSHRVLFFVPIAVCVTVLETALVALASDSLDRKSHV